MKAAVIHQYGGPEVLKYEDAPDPVPGPSEVLVKVSAASINPIDIAQRSGATKAWLPLQFPAIVGRDVSGTIVKIGDGVIDLAVGERVAATAAHTYAELVAGKAELFARVPDGLDLVDAAALPLRRNRGTR